MLATPYGEVARGKLAANAAEIARIARREGAGGLVVGLPLVDGRQRSAPPPRPRATGPTRSADATGLPAALWDERLSCAAVNRFLIEEAT